ncbi:hypothetical protein ACQ4M3_39670 [Leptolyngbya sp. AN03gr2]|uniref:hypothetical protein n=1 Tax=unclassified Leptolyngbya TaxID=2650499 RepID=UPI003D31F687
MGHYTTLKLEVFRDGYLFSQYTIDITEEQFKQPHKYWQNPNYKILGNQQETGWWWDKEGEFYLYPPNPDVVATEIMVILQFHFNPEELNRCRFSLDAKTLQQVDQWFQEGEQQAELDILKAKSSETTPCPYLIDSAIHWWNRGYRYKQRFLERNS